MTNGEKYKTIEERTNAFRKLCGEAIRKSGCKGCILQNISAHKCEFVWLDLEYKEVELKPCPLCGHTDIRVRKNNAKDVWYIFCNGCGCSTGGDVVRDMAIAAWNRRVK